MSSRDRIVVVFVASLVSVVAGAAFGAQPYYLTDMGNTLGVNGYSYVPSQISTVGGNLEVVGTAQNTGLGLYGWYWTKATGMVSLDSVLGSLPPSFTGAPAGYTYSGSYANGVNSSGQIVGTYTYGQGASSITNGFVYSIGGTVTNMVFPVNTGTEENPNNFAVTNVTNVNNNGIVSGSGEVGIDPTNQPYTYNVNTQAFINLFASSGAAGGVAAMVEAINSNGWLVGKGGSGPATAYAYNGNMWTSLGVPSGTWNNNGTPTNYTKGSGGIAIDTNGDVVGVVGTYTATKGDACYVPYNSGTSSWGTMVDLGNLTAYNSAYNSGQANGINDNGQIVGFDFNATKALASEYAFVAGTTAGSEVALNTLVSPANQVSWNLCTANAIDNAGDIVGCGLENGVAEVYLLKPAIPGDANVDGRVDINDLTIVLSNYNQSGAWAQGEFTGNGKVDINDLTIVLAHYNDTASASAGSGLSAVPEPGTLAVLGAGLAGLLAYAWRKQK